MRIIGLMLVSLLLASPGGSATKVETTRDKRADFAAWRTYSWTKGAIAFDADVDALIMAAVDAQMTRLGFTRAATGADVTIAYDTVGWTVLDRAALHQLGRPGGAGATSLQRRDRVVVIMRNAATSKPVWTASTREYVEPDRSKLGATIRAVVARLFETYPARKSARSK